MTRHTANRIRVRPGPQYVPSAVHRPNESSLLPSAARCCLEGSEASPFVPLVRATTSPWSEVNLGYSITHADSTVYLRLLSDIRLATRWTVRRSNPSGGKILRSRPDRPCGPPSLLYNGHRVFPGGKRPGRGVDHPPHLAPRLKEQ